MPSERNPFVGRDRELQLAAQLLNEVRLLTLLGPPNAGRPTFLAVWRPTTWIASPTVSSSSRLRDPRRVAGEPSIAQVIGVRGGREQSTHQSFAAYLRQRHLLLVLDNREQLHELGAVVSELLDFAPELTVLATSKSPDRDPQ